MCVRETRNAVFAQDPALAGIRVVDGIGFATHRGFHARSGSTGWPGDVRFKTICDARTGHASQIAAAIRTRTSGSESVATRITLWVAGLAAAVGIVGAGRSCFLAGDVVRLADPCCIAAGSLAATEIEARSMEDAGTSMTFDRA